MQTEFSPMSRTSTRARECCSRSAKIPVSLESATSCAYSIDELPQFLNVLHGEMSVVGPRPPLRCEVDQYDRHVRRRLLVRPGITGLWQISGRSDLSWEDSVRLDLSYVENWSMVADLAITAGTLRAVLRGTGAY